MTAEHSRPPQEESRERSQFTFSFTQRVHDTLAERGIGEQDLRYATVPLEAYLKAAASLPELQAIALTGLFDQKGRLPLLSVVNYWNTEVGNSNLHLNKSDKLKEFHKVWDNAELPDRSGEDYIFRSFTQELDKKDRANLDDFKKRLTDGIDGVFGLPEVVLGVVTTDQLRQEVSKK